MDYTQYLPYLLGGAGVLLQWLRASSKVAEHWYAAIAVLLALGCDLLTATYAPPWRGFAILLLVHLGQNVLIVLGGTQAASTAANLAVAMGADKNKLAVPVTNSK